MRVCACVCVGERESVCVCVCVFMCVGWWGEGNKKIEIRYVHLRVRVYDIYTNRSLFIVNHHSLPLVKYSLA